MNIEQMKELLTGSLDEKLSIITSLTESRLARLLGIDLNTENIPSSFDDVLFEVSLKRLNRIGQEGMESYSQEGLSMAFPDSDFDEYKDEIDAYKKANSDSGYMKVRFL
ncbi:phage head-tail connector protein [Enterococcus faecium]|nr:phage head-tail connector protein [Enterococcus faecium]